MKFKIVALASVAALLSLPAQAAPAKAPAKDAKVWVEFERGDPGYPIWSGGWWDDSTKPPAPAGPTGYQTKLWKGDTFSIEINDAPGATKMTLTVKIAGGDATIEAQASGVKISLGKTATVELASAGVSINGSNLKVLPA